MFEFLWYLIIIFVLASLIPACYSDLKTRKVPVWIWYPGVYVGIPLAILLFVLQIFNGIIPIENVYIYVGSALLLVGISLVAGYLNVFGGADAIAFCLVVLTAFFYTDPVNMRHPLFIFPFLSNFVACSIVIILGIFAINVIRKNYKYIKNPLFLFCTTTVNPKDLEGNHFIVMEDVKLIDGKVERSFITTPWRMTESTENYKSTVITSDPERYDLYKQLDRVLVMYIIPMIIPITAAYIITIFFGDVTRPVRMLLIGI
jgi:hypothetical protein